MAVADYRLFAAEELFFLEGDIHEAWHDLIGDFERAASALGETTVENLRDRGLYGPQLRLKINVWTKQREQARHLWGRIKEAGAKVPASLVHRLFDSAQTILGSLSFIPGIDAIEEFKSTLESIADGSKRISWRKRRNTTSD
jgi:hypothetical protein